MSATSRAAAAEAPSMGMARLLLRGMLVGLLAGVLAFAFARVYGEPDVDRSIAVEEAIAHSKIDHAKMDHGKVDHGKIDHTEGEAEEPELVSRAVQATPGLFTGVAVVGTALGGMFALLFALCYGRVSTLAPRAFAALLALVCFVTVHLVPDLKYPANPPAVGQPETIGIRTGLYFSMIAISVIAAVAAFSLRRLLLPRLGGWNATLAGLLAFAVMVAISFHALPVVNEVPDGFPAQTLWSFRLDSLAIQAIIWGTIGLLFGALTERSLERAPTPAATPRRERA